MKIARIWLAALALGLGLNGAPAPAKEKANTATPVWTEAFQSSPADYAVEIPRIPENLPEEVMKRFKITPEMIERFKARPPVKGVLRSRLAVSAGGSAVRIRLSNEESDTPLAIGAASLALAAGDGFDARPGSIRQLTFGGRSDVTIAEGAPVLSDPIVMRVVAGDELLVTVEVPEGLQLKPFGGAGMLTGEDGQAMSERISGGEVVVGRPIVSGASVLSAGKTRVIVALGDSITDGNRVSPTELRGWPEQLARRLAARKGGRNHAVINAGIGGNRVLADGWGISALARFDRDVARIADVSHVILLEGINDIGNSGKGMMGEAPLLDPQDLIAGYRQIIARAHQRGIKVIVGTLLPFEGAPYYRPEKEPVRAAVNEWIRTSGEPDAVIDFDAITRDPGHPARLAPLFDSGDSLHPGEAGYKAMGDAIDLALFD